MGRSLRCRLMAALLPVLGAALFGLTGERPASGQDANAGEPTLLTRGPIHEAFAEPINFNPKPGPLIPRQPPANIEEIPPDQKPDGDNVSWIPGYWHWDDDKNEFLWVSGFWRVMPPGRQWIPGYWNQVDDKWQWVSGYWANQEQKEAVYLPEPPTSLENGPQTPQPSNDHIWVPGTWVYRETRYLWQPGYWIIGSPGWIWVPACYVWTPCGYVFVDGYWDYSLRRRGCLFAPFYYDAVYVRPGWFYRPTVCIDIDVVTAHLWCRPRFGHYYFGDYYDATYINLGFTPWFNFTYVRGGYCPIYTYHAWYFRGRNPGWDAALRADYQFRFVHVDARPPRTFVQQQVIINNITNVTNVNVNNTTVVNNRVSQFNRNQVQMLALAKPMNQLVARANADADAPLRFQRVNEEQIRQAVARQQELRQAHRQRLELERATAARLLPAGGAGNGSPAGIGSREGDKPTPLPGGGTPAGVAPGGAATSGNPGLSRIAPRPVVPTAPIKVELPKTPIVAKPLPAGDGGAEKPVAGRPSRTPPPAPRSIGSAIPGSPAGGAGAAIGGAAKPGISTPALPTLPTPVTEKGPAVKPVPTAAAGEEVRSGGPRPAVPTNVARPAITKPALPAVNPPAGTGNPPAARPISTLPGRDLRPPASPLPSKPVPLPNPRLGGGAGGELGAGGEPEMTKPPAVTPTPQPKPPAVGGSSGSGGPGRPQSDPGANPPVIRPRPMVPPPAGMPPGASGGAGSSSTVGGAGSGGPRAVKPPESPSLPPSPPSSLPPRAQPSPQPAPQPKLPGAGAGSGSSSGGVGAANPPPARGPTPPPAMKSPPPVTPPPSRMPPTPPPSARPPAPPPAAKSPPPASPPPSRTPPPPPPKTPPPKSDGKSP